MDARHAIDELYDRIKACKVKAYKDKAPTKDKPKDYIVINHLAENMGQLTTSVPVHINIYFKKSTNGLLRDRNGMYDLRNQLISLAKNGTDPGYLFDLTQSFSELDTTHDKDYDILITRFDLNITA